jgi:hypothetical protein
MTGTSFKFVGSLKHGSMSFFVQVFAPEGECTEFRIWGDQRGGRDVADAVFQGLRKAIEDNYGAAPSVKLHEDYDIGADDFSYIWANDDYLLILSEWIESSSKGVSLSHLRRNGTRMEFGGTLEGFRKLVDTKAGSLPDGWPRAAKPPRIEPLKIEPPKVESPKQVTTLNGPGEAAQKGEVAEQTEEVGQDNLIWVFVGLVVLALGVVGARIGSKRSAGG